MPICIYRRTYPERPGARRGWLDAWGTFPALPDPGVLDRRMCRLAAQASLAVHKQHLVSGVLLGQFAAPIGQRGAPQVYSLNLEYPHAKLRGRGWRHAGRRRSPTS